MSEPRTLVEHFFRHEFGRVSAVLARSLGLRRLDLVEDVVHAALALRTLCGFGTAEIARALLTTDSNIQKRIERARDRLRELDVGFDTPPAAQLRARLDAVLAVVYLLFSQGCHATHGDMPIRRDVCDEARRLAQMLAAHPVGDVPAAHALLALMCFHAACFAARIAHDGAILLLEEQDRATWNWDDVREGVAPARWPMREGSMRRPTWRRRWLKPGGPRTRISRSVTPD
ncbi:MAG TPA: DUF6596 domain-containing protein [Tepidisphaeraceae bacterium]|jgi:predicted RNA polymerase sigma factor